MIRFSFAQVISVVTAALLIVITADSPTHGETPDPTHPSSLITERLAPLAGISIQPSLPTTTEANPPVTPRIRLRAIVLRDSNHGTALITVNGAGRYVVSLKRNLLEKPGLHLVLDGTPVTIVDFSSTSILFRTLDTHQNILVH